MVNIAAWNIRGLNSPIKQMEVRSLLVDNNVSILGLLETKVKKENCGRIKQSICDWNTITNYNHAYNGRVWVLWDETKVAVEELCQGSQFIHCKATLLDINKVVELTFVYAMNTSEEREELWLALEQIASSIQSPWDVLGDLNVTLTHEERLKGGEPVFESTEELENFTSLCELVDLNYTGVFHTWCNKQEGLARVNAKLDRILVNLVWLQDLSWSDALFCNPGISDHSPGILHVTQQQKTPCRRFKFCNFWTNDPNYPAMVREAWEEPVNGIPMFRIVKKLKLLKGKLKSLHKSKHSNLLGRLKEAKGKLDDVQSQLQSDPKNMQLQQSEKVYYEEYVKLASVELSLYKQKTKEEWMMDMDYNTSYFHARVAEKQARTRISRIFYSDGKLVTKEEEIAELFIQFYSKLLGTAAEEIVPVEMNILQKGKMLTEQHKAALCDTITEEKIHNAVLSIAQDKAPGPDGYGSGFFRASWNTIREEVTAAVQDFFRSGKLLKQVNNTIVTLVLKLNYPNTVGDYRPIACCNVLYKIIVKILAARMAFVLPDIISNTQGAFVKDRSIMENILICQDIVRNYQREGGTARCLMKLDIKKAYDSLEWDFLRQMLIGLGFPDMFLQWIMTCITTSSFSFAVNGKS